MKKMNIEPFQGVGTLKLGSTTTEVEALLGAPDKRLREKIGKNSYSDEWDYDELGLELTFLGSFGLSYIAVSSPLATLDGIFPVGMDIDLLRKKFPKIVLDGDRDDEGTSYIDNEKELLFWVVKGIVESVTVFASEDLDDQPNDLDIKSWGLSDSVERDLANNKPSGWLVWAAGWTTWITMVCGFAVGGLYVWPFLEQSLEKNAIDRGLTISGLLHDVNFGLGLLIFLFVWIITSSLCTGLLVRWIPGKSKFLFFFAALNDDGCKPHNEKALTKTLEKAQSFSSAVDLINYWADTFLRYALK